VGHSFDDLQFRACDVCRHVTTAGDRNQGVFATVHDQRWRADRAQHGATIAAGQKSGQLTRHTARMKATLVLIDDYLAQALRTSGEIGAGDGQLAFERVFDQAFLVARFRQGSKQCL